MKIATSSSLALVLASSIASSVATIPAFTSPSIRGGALRMLETAEATPDEDPEATKEPSVEEESSDPSLESLDDEEKGRMGLPTKRDCKTKSGATKVSHECQAKVEQDVEGAETKVEDEIDFEVEADDKGICISVGYEQEVKDDTTETETDAKFEVCFHELLEYTKAAGATDQAYDWDNDSVLQSIPMTNWQDFSEVISDETGMSTFTATSESEDGGNVTMTFTISPAGDGDRITANTMKADVRIVNFPWMDAGNSFLTLLSDVESKLKVEVDDEEVDELDDVEEAGGMPEEDETEKEEPDDEEPMDEQEPTEEEPADEPEPTEADEPEERFLDSKTPKPKEVKISFADVVDTVGFSPLGTVTWADTAVAVTAANDTDVVEVGRGEKLIEVIATSPPQGSERYLADKTYQQIAFSFVGDAAQGSPDIFWDPEAGVDYAAASSTTSGVGALVSSASVIGGLVSALLLLAY